MLMLLSIVYIIVFSHRALVWLSPVFRAVADNVDIPLPRGRVWFAVGLVIDAVAWAYVFSVVLEGLYV